MTSHDQIHAALDKLTFQPPARGERVKGRPRFRRIVLAQDGTTGAALAEAWAAHLTSGHDADVLVATILPIPPALADAGVGFVWWPVFQEEHRRVQASARAAAGESLARVAAWSLRVSQAVVPGRPVQGLVGVSRALRADLVVLGSARRGAMERALLGSVGQGVHVMHVVEHAGAPEPVRGHLHGEDDGFQGGRCHA